MADIFKDFREDKLGYDNDKVQKLYPGAVCFQPMKIGSLPGTRGITLEDIATDKDYYTTEKKDGFWYALEKVDADTYYLFSRNKSRTTGLPTEKFGHVIHFKKYLEDLPNGTILIGEVWTGDNNDDSSDVTKIMGALETKALERQKEGKYLHFWVHDMIAYDGINYTETKAYERYKILKKAFELHIPENEYIQFAKEYEGKNALDFFNEVIENGGEGIVMKRKKDKYLYNKRPAYSSVKVKQSADADVIIMGFEDPTRIYDGTLTSDYVALEEYVETDGVGSWVEKELGLKNNIEVPNNSNFRLVEVTKPYYYGWKTSIKIGLLNSDGALVEIGTVSSGLNDELRKEFAENPSKYIGKVIECSAMSLDKKEQTLRHPVFERFREDKNAEECTFESTF